MNVYIVLDGGRHKTPERGQVIEVFDNFDAAYELLEAHPEANLTISRRVVQR